MGFSVIAVSMPNGLFSAGLCKGVEHTHKLGRALARVARGAVGLAQAAAKAHRAGADRTSANKLLTLVAAVAELTDACIASGPLVALPLDTCSGDIISEPELSV
jgi:hypothetical protein